MSAPATEGATVPVERKKGLSKYVSRFKSVLKRSDAAKRNSLSSKSPGAAGSAEASSSTPVSTKPTPDITAATTTTPKATTRTAALIGPTGARTVISPSQERVRRLAEKYGIELDLLEWKRGPETVERVEKPIRMRIHRTCHRCNTTFGASKTCAGCKHTRCEQCPRYPRKKSPAEKGKGVKRSTAGVGGVAFGESAAETIEGVKKKSRHVLTMPSKTGGQDLVRRKPMQRVRRTCHKCQTLYIPPNKTCSVCGHIRCGDCPRDPAKRHKYPDGYPGDADPEDPVNPSSITASERVEKIPRRTVRYSCHIDNTIFKNSEGKCSTCGHEKCAECLRLPAKKRTPEPDPVIWAKVQERLAGLTVGGRGTDPPKE